MKPKENEEEIKPQSVDEYIDAAPKELRGTLRRSYERDKAHKVQLVNSLKENKRNPFSEEELNAKPLEELQKLAKLSQIEVDYSGQGGNEPHINVDDDSPGDMPKLEDLDKKDK